MPSIQHFSHHQYHYAGFWRRLLAFLLDTIMLSLITTSLAAAIFGFEHVMQMQAITDTDQIDWSLIILDQALPAIWTVSFWLVWKATPAKLLLDCQVVDADSLQKASLNQLVLRYLCYLVSAIPLGLGFMWIAFNQRKQGWHDKLSGTVVILQDESLVPLELYT